MSKKLLWQPEDIEFLFSSYHGYEKRLLDLLGVVPYIGDNNKQAWSPELVNLFIGICSTIDSISRHIVGNGAEGALVEVMGRGDKRGKKRVGDLKVKDFEQNLWWPLGLNKSFVVVYL